ncbi:MAG: hypothetical protein WC681_14360 [Sterolibacterium sp.]|jgi:hypothetical protein
MNSTLAFLRRNMLDFGLLVLLAMSTVLMLKSSTDPRPDCINGTWLEEMFRPFPTGNQITFDITVGVIVSLFIYVLVVRLPEHQKRRRLRTNLRRQHDALKEATILQFLWACNVPASSELIERLKNRHDFKTFFKERVSDSQDRWHAVLNGLDETKVSDIAHELGLFRREVEYVLSAIDVTDPQVFGFMKRLTRILSVGERWSEEYDHVKALGGFMWSVHTGWDWVHGYTGKDSIADMIDRI